MVTGRNLTVLIVFLLGISTAITGCGRKGRLEKPISSAEIVETDEQGRPIKREEEPVEDNPFILDGLI